MTEPFLGEIRMFACDFAPKDWLPAAGQTMPISQNALLFSILDTRYGGDGRTTFRLPDLRGRTPIHRSSKRPIGNSGGAEAVALRESELPAHSHSLQGSSMSGNSNLPAGSVLATEADSDMPYGDYDAAHSVALRMGTVAYVGGDMPHNNMQPFQALGFYICINGTLAVRPLPQEE